MDYYEEYIVKYLLKKNKDMTRVEAEKKAKIMYEVYCEANKERDQKRQEEFEILWGEALQKENDQFALEYLSDDELVQYFSSEVSNDQNGGKGDIR